jgi:hypothetical protein
LFHVRRYAEKLSQMSACRTSHDADVSRIDLVLLAICPKPAHSGFHVMDCSRELVLGGESITHRHGDITVLYASDTKAVVALTIARTEAATVNANNRWERAIPYLGTGHIQLKVLTVRIGEFDLRLKDDILWHSEICRFLGLGGIGAQKADSRGKGHD